MLSKAELQRLRSLREKKHRAALGLFVIEGEKVITELVAADYPFETIYATPAADLAPLKSTRAPLVALSPEEMARISHFPTPSTLLAVGRIARHAFKAAELSEGFTLALDGVQDAGNVGTLVRIADWFGFNRVLLSPDCADLFHQKVINASMGSFARLPVHTVDLAPAFANLRAGSSGAVVPILGCDLRGRDVHALPALRNAIVVIGSEGRGLSAAVKKVLTDTVTIPRYGAAESLNAAVAAAIVCDNLRRLAH